MEVPLISVIVITYNQDKYILDALESINAQTYGNIELIVSDDCSSDGTVDICRKWIERNGMRFKRTALITSPNNTGTASNCNRGIKAAQGKWIKLLAGDDALEPNILHDYMRHVLKNNEVRIIHSNAKKYHDKFEEKYLVETTDLSHLKINSQAVTPGEQFQILLRTGPIIASTVMVKKSVYDEVGLFDERSPFWEDNPMWLKIVKKGIKIHFYNTVGAKYRIHSESVQGNQRNLQLFSYYKLSRDKYYKKNYLKELPIIERVFRGFLINRNILLSKVTKNKRSFFALGILVITGFLPEKVLALTRAKHKS